MHVAGFDRAAQRGARCEQAALADHLVERARPHALGERTQRVAIDAQQVGFGECGGCGVRSHPRAMISACNRRADDVHALGRREA